jgi:hypothetical protein
MATTWLMTLESDASPLRRRRALLLRSAVLRRISTPAAATRNLVYAGLPLPPCSKPFSGDRAPLAVDYPARAHTYHTRTGAIRTFQGEPAEESSAGLKLFRKCDVQIDQTSRDGSHHGSRQVPLAVQVIDLAQGQRRNDENARALVVALRLGLKAGSFGARCAWCRWRRGSNEAARTRPRRTRPWMTFGIVPQRSFSSSRARETDRRHVVVRAGRPSFGRPAPVLVHQVRHSGQRFVGLK